MSIEKTHMTLRMLLFALNGEQTYLNTNNYSWPEKWRFRRIYYADLYIRIIKENQDNPILDELIERITLNGPSFKYDSDLDLSIVLVCDHPTKVEDLVKINCDSCIL